MFCEKCKAPAKWTTSVDGKWVGPCCVPQEVWNRYKGWADREQLSAKRAETARRNFQLGATA